MAATHHLSCPGGSQGLTGPQSSGSLLSRDRGAVELTEQGVKRQGGPRHPPQREGAGSQGVGVFPTFPHPARASPAQRPPPILFTVTLNFHRTARPFPPCSSPGHSSFLPQMFISYMRRCCPRRGDPAVTRMHRGHPTSGPECLPRQEPPTCPIPAAPHPLP